LDKTKAYEGIKKLFKTLPKEEWPTAVASMSGLMTESTMHALRELDLRIPEDVSVVSYGELSSDLISPRITSIKQDANRMGKKAAELVLERLEEVEKDVTNRHYREILFGTEIVNIQK
jgi:LacI family transcriptional regulator